MRVVLKVETGAYAGRTILLQTGQWMNVGRTERADFALPHDDRMSGLHFRVECQSQSCRVRDLDSTNGTCVNDAKIVEAELNDGDRVSAGRTTFAVSIEHTESISDLAISPGSSQASPVNELADETNLSPSRRSLDSAALMTVQEQPAVAALLAVVDSNRPYAQGLQDPDADVRRETLYAAARTGQKWLLEYCRCLAQSPVAEHWEALQLLAILGHPSDLSRILTIGRSKQLGPRRFEILASFGHPRVIRDLLVEMENQDPATAAAAGAAFNKITGEDVTAEQAPSAPPDSDASATDSEQDVQGEEEEIVACPDARLAEQHWNRIKDQFGKGRRWRRAIEVSRPVDPSVLESLDMESRYEILLRGIYEGW